MKLLILPIVLLLSACSTCHIPLGVYGSQGGSEYLTTLDLRSREYALFFEQWEPGGYKNRSKDKEQGSWSCTGNVAEIVTQQNIAKVKYKKSEKTLWVYRK